MPNLENLKKQAKLYVRWHRDGYYPVATRIRDVLPSFRHLSDRDVLARDFKLSDAQELIARKHGFESWEALRTGVQHMTDHQAEALPKTALLTAEPMIFVADIAASCSFYEKKLGFTVAFTYGEPPFYAQVFRDGARLNLRCTSRPAIDPQRRAATSCSRPASHSTTQSRCFLNCKWRGWNSTSPSRRSRGERGHSSYAIRTAI